MQSDTENVLLFGSGPAAMQLAVLLKQTPSLYLGIANRPSENWLRWQESYIRHGCILSEAAKPALSALSGYVQVNRNYACPEHIEPVWQTLILAVPADAYLSVLRSLPEQVLISLRRVILLSPSLGSQQIIRHWSESQGLSLDVIGFSTYFAATKCQTNANGSRIPTHVITKAIKKKVYLSSSQNNHPAQTIWHRRIETMLDNIGVGYAWLNDSISVEARNITSYVHPALFINDFSLEAITQPPAIPVYLYKLFPEGPITAAVIRRLVDLWRDISVIVSVLGGERVNLLQFLNDDNYPVRAESIPREKIDQFTDLSAIEQEYLIYIRYSAILIDPFSTPDETGRYFDFSAVPFPRAQVESGQRMLPRIPAEDIRLLYRLREIARVIHVETPTVSELIHDFETWLQNKPDIAINPDVLTREARQDLTYLSGHPAAETNSVKEPACDE
ncbi:opine metallophore biosynthesis dehydrogenase [Photobacterium sp. TLY01]|uniref:opine metallophore biosynthesis dehydrogenase n=1 Tax=Photobacterium sp. TLY01 TaxID=2907534 RepID=UPI001F320FB1|nr:opine metallophore biosynthesis dehydrogenase [Photobacterium sp. TLY01]UIP30676.1 opine metallophore biosynthesis dehydrogenase [Photobacterium sp. TLY01]